MTLTEVEVDQLAIINYIDTQPEQIKDYYKLMSFGVIGGLEVRKLSEVATCAEYRIEGIAARMVISKELSDHIMVDLLDETIE